MVAKSRFKRTTYYWTIEIISLFGLVCAVAPLFLYERLPKNALVPVHFDISGNPDSWGDEHYITAYSLMSVFFYILIYVLELNYKVLNYPVKITPNNSSEIYRLGVNFVRHIKLFTVLIFSYLTNISFLIAIGKLNTINQFVIVLLTGGLLISTVVFVVKMCKVKD